MARRHGSKGNTSAKKQKPLKRSDGKLKRWNTVDDIPMGEEDQFHASRDKILLDGDSYGGEDDGDEDEVFALKGLDDESEDEGGEYEQEDMEDEELEEETPKPNKKAKKKGKGKGKALESSDEEEEEEEEGWGRGRAAYYSSNADQLESDDDEGNELEEQEAKRLQAKMREEMKDHDFGLNDNPELEPQEDTTTLEEATPPTPPTLPTDKKDLLRHLEKTNPESLALARDWEDIAPKLEKTRERIAQTEADDPGALSLGMIHLYYQALLSYGTMLAFYLHLRASPKYAQRPTLLRDHPILQRLLVLKQSLSTLEDLDFAVSDSEDYEDEYMDLDEADILADGESMWALDHYQGLEPDELHDLLDDAKASIEQPLPPTPARKADKPPKKKRKTVDSVPESTGPVFDLVEPEFVSSKPLSSRVRVDDSLGDAYGEATALNETDAADKSARKKSLRFHTQKIESASARRTGARNQTAGGDDDIPYRERKKEKEAKLVREAAKRSNEQGGADLDDVEPEPRAGDKRSRGNEDDDDGSESPDDYYELVKKKSTQKKEKKKADYEEAHGRTRLPLEDGDNSGPRSLTRAILTNKGLTPHRPKSVRNPRVKKRQKFEKAKRKISSQKAVYKGGLAETGRYDGERSGISKVVKSVRLG